MIYASRRFRDVPARCGPVAASNSLTTVRAGLSITSAGIPSASSPQGRSNEQGASHEEVKGGMGANGLEIRQLDVGSRVGNQGQNSCLRDQGAGERVSGVGVSRLPHPGQPEGALTMARAKRIARPLTDEQKERLHDVPTTMRGIFRRAFGTGSKPAVFKAKCLDCCCYQRKEVRLCTVAGCPIWPWRPFQRKRQSTQPPSGVTARNGGPQ